MEYVKLSAIRVQTPEYVELGLRDLFINISVCSGVSSFVLSMFGPVFTSK